MRCERAAAIGRDMSRRLDAFYSEAERATAAGQLERHYRRECECYGTTEATIGGRKRAHIDWSAFDD